MLTACMALAWTGWSLPRFQESQVNSTMTFIGHLDVSVVSMQSQLLGVWKKPWGLTEKGEKGSILTHLYGNAFHEYLPKVANEF